MIKYPEYKIERSPEKPKSSIKAAVDAGMVALGQRYMIDGHPVTCVDIDENKYIFSMDEICALKPFNDIHKIFKKIYETGKIEEREILPINVMEDIDFLFVPSERQVFGENKYGVPEKDRQFEWFKRGEFTRVKGFRGSLDSANYEIGDTCNWWLSTDTKEWKDSHACMVRYTGATSYERKDLRSGIPLFFQITKENETDEY